MSNDLQLTPNSKRRPGHFGPARALLLKGQQPLVLEASALANDAIERLVDNGNLQHLVAESNHDNWASHIHQPCEESELAT